VRRRALFDSETRYRRVFETAQDGILIRDADSGLIVDVNLFFVGLLAIRWMNLLAKRSGYRPV
jgi:hypothetical protein